MFISLTYSQGLIISFTSFLLLIARDTSSDTDIFDKLSKRSLSGSSVPSTSVVFLHKITEYGLEANPIPGGR